VVYWHKKITYVHYLISLNFLKIYFWHYVIIATKACNELIISPPQTWFVTYVVYLYIDNIYIIGSTVMIINK